MRNILFAPAACCLALLCIAGLAVASPAPAGAQADPLGATVHGDGVVFRLWAPYVKSVAVSVDGAAPVPMALEGGHDTPPDMIWTAHVAGAKIGDGYRYIIDNGAGQAKFVDPYAQEITGYDNSASSVIIDTTPLDDHFVMPPVNKLVIYEMHVGTFHPDAAGNYTFAGAAEKLAYLKSLGVNAVELMPIDANPPGRYRHPPTFDWGYDGLSLFAINPSYGTPADFKGFVRACHALGIAVIVDVVYNHMVRGNLLQDFRGVSSADYPDGIYFYGKVDPGPTPWGPRPNFDLPQVRSYIIDNALMWLKEYGVDGERWDSVDSIRAYQPAGGKAPVSLPGGQELLRQFNLARPPHKLAIAEDTWLYPQTSQSVESGGLGFDCQWNNTLSEALRQAISPSADSARSLAGVAKALALQLGDSAFHRVVYTEDHDTVGHPPWQIRFPASADPQDPASAKARRLSTLASAIVLTAPGVAMLFQGQEMLDPRAFDFGSATYVDWRLADENAAVVDTYRKLIALRLDRAGNTAGLTEENLDLFHVDSQTQTLAYRRYGAGGPGDDVIVIANFSSEPWPSLKIGFPRAGRWRIRLDTASALSPKNARVASEPAVVARQVPLAGMPCSATVSIGPYTALILSQ